MTAPDGAQVPPADQPPFFSIIEARAEIRRLGGGTARTIRRGDAA